MRRAGRPLDSRRCQIGSLVLLGAVAAGVWSLFPTYVRGAETNSSDLGLILLHVLPLAAWLVAAPVAATGAREAVRVSVGLVLGSTVVVAGLDVAAVGQLVTEHLHGGLGFWLGLVSVGLAASGGIHLAAALASSRVDGPRPDRRWRPLTAAVVAIGGAAAAVGYGFGWRRYRIVSKILHTTGHHTIPSVFDDRAAVMAGAAVVLAGLAVAPLLATGWRSRRGGGAVAVGACVGLGGYVALNLYEVVGPASLGLNPLLMRRYAVHLTATVTVWFVVAAVGLAVLLIVGLWSLLRPGGRSLVDGP